MLDEAIILKGSKDGLNVVININKFRNFNDMLNSLVERLMPGKRFYKNSILKITIELDQINEKDMEGLKKILIEQFEIKDCIFENKEEKKDTVFNGIYEGKTKFIRMTIRSGQKLDYSGNLIIIGDVNPDAEISAFGNIIVLGELKGHAFAGSNGNHDAIIAAYKLQPQIIQIGDIMSRSPEDDLKPSYPEVARIKDGIIIVEPYLPNKFL